MAEMRDYEWVRNVMKQVIGDDAEIKVRGGGTTPEGPELWMGVYLGSKVERLQLCSAGWDLNERPDREAYVRAWTAETVKKLKTR